MTRIAARGCCAPHKNEHQAARRAVRSFGAVYYARTRMTGVRLFISQMNRRLRCLLTGFGFVGSCGDGVMLNMSADELRVGMSFFAECRMGRHHTVKISKIGRKWIYFGRIRARRDRWQHPSTEDGAYSVRLFPSREVFEQYQADLASLQDTKQDIDMISRASYALDPAELRRVVDALRAAIELSPVPSIKQALTKD